MNKDQIKFGLQELTDICKDGAKGYETAAKNIEYSDLRTLFLRLSQQRKQFIEEINDEAIKLGIHLDTTGTIKGIFHRTWLNAKASISGSTNEKVIEESMTGEKAAIETYGKVLAEPEIPGYLTEMLSEQQYLIKVAIDQLNALKKEVAVHS
ncbi:PA2169 family four-helix-bundle protein [Saccharicrinis sp. FJH54]|uniref:ferritin-like domain-containing protein n=1 Tax=Saccharicrinis sp. FJH54 TaxID=3344665 RepID=UPI0035D4650E